MKITIANEKLHSINPDMFGLFFEDINYAADGGLYAEMIENRSFEFIKTTGDVGAFAPEYSGLYGWYKFPKDCPFVSMETRTVNPAVEENPHYLHLLTRKANAGFTNKSYDGIALVNGEGYHGEFWMNVPKYTGDVIVSIEKNKDVYFSQVFSVSACDQWKRYTYKFTSDVTVRGARLVIKLATPGEADFDFISLFPDNAVCGVFRKDLADKLRDLHPGFLRFPGGCIIEGNTLDNRYQWKHSVGEPRRRRSNWNRWSVHNANRENNYTSVFSHYNQTYGLGYFEYFLLCEYIGAKALPVLNVGLACQYTSKEWVEIDDPEFQNYVQDAVDLIEFANGDVSTKWGALRAEMGHPQPFNLELMGIGNEQWQTEEVDFFTRYTIFEEAIHKVNPEMKLIGSAGPDVHTPRYEAAWKFYRDNKSKKNFTYAIDEHYYMAPEWFLENNHFYDEYDRDIKVFSGEYAAHPKVRLGSEKSGNTLMGALSEAAFLTGVERNSDVVIMSSYAPLFAREGYVQWAPDMIWFNDVMSYGTPSYYVQKMYANNVGSHFLKSVSSEDAEKKGIFYSATFDDKKEEVIFKIVNTSDEETMVTVDTTAFGDKKTAELTVLGGGLQPELYNSCEAPEKVKAYTFWPKASDELKLMGKSFVVARFGFKDQVTND